MIPAFKKYIWQTLLLGLILAVCGFILFFAAIPEHYHPLLPLILLATMLINIGTFRLIVSAKGGSSSNVMLTISKSFALKFLSYILLAVVLVLIEKGKTERIMLVLSEFFLYIIFTSHEVSSFIRNEKNKHEM